MVCPVSAGEFFSAALGEFDVAVPGGWLAADEMPDAALVAAVLPLLNPGD
jgi:hypothetical protein